MVKNQGLLPAARTNWQPQEGFVLEVEPPAPGQASDEVSPADFLPQPPERPEPGLPAQPLLKFRLVETVG